MHGPPHVLQSSHFRAMASDCDALQFIGLQAAFLLQGLMEGAQAYVRQMLASTAGYRVSLVDVGADPAFASVAAQVRPWIPMKISRAMCQWRFQSIPDDCSTTARTHDCSTCGTAVIRGSGDETTWQRRTAWRSSMSASPHR